MKAIRRIFLRMRRMGNAVRETRIRMKKGVQWIPIVGITLLYYRIRYNVFATDYVRFKFWENTQMKRAHHFTHKNNIYFVETINDPTQIGLLRDKICLLQRMGDTLGRKYLNICNADDNHFFAFLSEHRKVFVKPRFGAFGEGIRIIDQVLDRDEAKALRAELIKDNCTLAEEFIVQHPLMEQISRGSVAVLKIHTVQVEKDAQVVLLPLLQLGKKGMTHSHSGFMIPVDLRSGALILHEPINEELRAQLSQAFLTGNPLPFYKEALVFAQKLARLVPEITFACWDIAIGPHGPVVVEGNGASGAFSDFQVHCYHSTGLGAKQIYEDIAQYLVLRNTLGQQGRKKIEDFLFYETENKKTPDILLVLGSTRCKDRIRLAAQILGSKPSMQAVLSGGNACFESFNEDDGAIRTEAEYMREYLLRFGVEDKRLWIENRSSHTAENIDFSLKLIEKKLASFLRMEKPCIGVVSAGFHMRRVFNLIYANKDCERYDWVSKPVYSERTSKQNWFSNVEGLKIILAEYERLSKN